MIPRRLKLENVFQHHNLEHIFRPGITGIVGRNGCGKSNFLEALHFAQTGQTGTDSNKSDLLTWGVPEGRTIYDFEHNGDEYALTRNLHTTYVKLESDALETPLKNADANAFMESVLGMSFKGFYETCWTPQGTLTNILTMTHAARVALFQRLAKTREAETIRGIIQEHGLNKLPTFLDREQDIQTIKAEIVELGGQIVQLEISATSLESMFAEYNQQLTDVQQILALPTQATYLFNVQTAQDLLTKDQASLEAAERANDLTPIPEASGPTPEMEQERANAQMIQSKLTEAGQLEKNLKQFKSQLPAKVDDPEPLRAELEKMNQELGEMKPRADLAKNRICPTCQRPFEFEGGEAAREKVLKEYGAKLTDYNNLHGTFGGLKAAFDNYQRASRSLQASIDATENRLKTVLEEIKMIPPSTFDQEVYNKAVADQQAYVRYLNEKHVKDNLLRQLQRDLDRSQTALATAQAARFADDATRQQAQEFMANYTDLQERRKNAAADLSAAKSRQNALQQQVVTLESEQARRADVAHVRSLFERAREKLHRDVLPKLVMQKVLYGLNALLDQYLSVFDTNFTAYIDENFDFMCSFAVKSDVPARSLSGGQKVALSLAFKFAVSDLLAASVPFLVLDEPTVWLDEINKPRLAEVLTKAREVTEKGVYVLVATHEPLLFPAFSRLFDVSG
jgi:DNA repair exonuclease SbcCD ATPase subunit